MNNSEQEDLVAGLDKDVVNQGQFKTNKCDD